MDSTLGISHVIGSRDPTVLHAVAVYLRKLSGVYKTTNETIPGGGTKDLKEMPALIESAAAVSDRTLSFAV